MTEAREIIGAGTQVADGYFSLDAIEGKSNVWKYELRDDRADTVIHQYVGLIALNSPELPENFEEASSVEELLELFCALTMPHILETLQLQNSSDEELSLQEMQSDEAYRKAQNLLINYMQKNQYGALYVFYGGDTGLLFHESGKWSIKADMMGFDLGELPLVDAISNFAEYTDADYQTIMDQEDTESSKLHEAYSTERGITTVLEFDQRNHRSFPDDIPVRTREDIIGKGIVITEEEFDSMQDEIEQRYAMVKSEYLQTHRSRLESELFVAMRAAVEE